MEPLDYLSTSVGGRTGQMKQRPIAMAGRRGEVQCWSKPLTNAAPVFGASERVENKNKIEQHEKTLGTREHEPNHCIPIYLHIIFVYIMCDKRWLMFLMTCNVPVFPKRLFHDDI